MTPEKQKERLLAQITSARVKLDAVEKKEFRKANKGLLGRCFKYRNCYSCPQTEADYWWMYFRAERFQGSWIAGTSFQLTSSSRLDIDPNHMMVAGQDYIPIPKSEFVKAWESIIAPLNDKLRTP